VAVAVAVGVGVKVTVAVAVGVKVAVAVAVDVAVAVGVGVGLGVGVGVGVGLIVLAVCMATISLSDNALFQIAACWMLPLPKGAAGAPLRACIMDVRSQALPVARVALAVATLTPSTNNSNAVPLRLNVIECQVESNATPPVIGLDMTVLLPITRAAASPVEVPPTPTRLLSVVLLVRHGAH
jgi:hypothetical protein